MMTRRLFSGFRGTMMKLFLLVLLFTSTVTASTKNEDENKQKIASNEQDSAPNFLSTNINLETTEDENKQKIASNEQDSAPNFLSTNINLETTEESSLEWPFPSNKNKTDNSCASHKNCFECSTSSSLCHWCAHDAQCHAKGSVHGCFEGVDCTNHTKPDHPKSKNETKCASHMNCTECALSSYMCHWCASDNACHAIGSYYGCVSGVNCYSNDRCRRKEPAPIEGIVFEEMGVLPIVLILFLGSICFCCSTLGYCVAGGVKGAYDDLADIASQQGGGGGGQVGPVVTIRQTTQPPPVANHESHDEEEAAGAEDEDANNELEPLVNGQGQTEYRLMAEAPVATSRTRAASRHMDRLFTACTVCYVISLMAVGGFVLASIRYFPKVPQYNICNDSVAWKSLVDSMTAVKVDATIEILMSIMNPNHFDVALDMGRGSFSHDGAHVGTFEIPPATVKAMSITDMTILAKFTPEKWEALALTAEYYRGTLALDVDSQASIRVPALANYSYQAKVTDMRVHVNDPTMMDRHLCACPQWKDAKNKTLSLN